MTRPRFHAQLDALQAGRARARDDQAPAPDTRRPDPGREPAPTAGRPEA